VTKQTASTSSLSLARRDAHASSDQFSESFFRRIAELAMSALHVPVVAIRTVNPNTLWVAAQGGRSGDILSAQLQSSTLFRRLCQSTDMVVDDVWALERYTALVDLERFEYRFFAGMALSDASGEVAGQLCVLDRSPRTLEPHHRDVLNTLAQMAQGELDRQREAARRRRGEALQDRLQRVLQMIARDEPIDVTLEALMYLVEGQLPGPAAIMHWLDPTDWVLRPVAAPSMPNALVEATDGLPADAEAGSIGVAVHDGEEVLYDDAPASIHWTDMRAAVEEAGFTTSWSFPVRSAEGRHVLGAITLFGSDALVPTGEMRQTVAIATQIAAVALERDRDRSLLAQTQEQHRRFLSQCHEGMYRVDLSPPVRTGQPLEAQIRQVFERAHIAECNETFAQNHGFSQARDVIGRPLLDLYGEGQDLAQLPILRAIDHDYVLEAAQSCEVDRSGQQRWFVNHLRGAIEDGALVSFWGGQREVTKQKHAEYALRESEHRYRTLVELTPSPVIVHSEEAIEFVNAAGADFLGAGGPDEVQGRPLTDFMDTPAADRLVRRARQPDAPHEATVHEIDITRVDGESVTTEVAACHVLHRGRPAVLSVLRTATRSASSERRLLASTLAVEEARQKAEEVSRLKSAFMANMNHEIRTPLTAIIGFAEILGNEIDHPSHLDVHEIVDHIRGNGQRLLWTLDSILNLSRVEAGTLELQSCSFDVVREVEDLVDTFRLMANEKGLRLALEGKPSAAHVSMDRIAFERIVGNLIANAIRETEEGTVTLYVRKRQEGPEVIIEDTSVNTSEHLGQALQEEGTSAEALRQERPGLAVAKQLLAMVNGSITVTESAKGGNRYLIRFHTSAPSAAHHGAGVFSNGTAPAS
jgi:PAS domain S-box-containing protein